jgi:hypothetical protein
MELNAEILQTKLTTRKEHKCPLCTFKSFDMEKITKHITEYGLRQIKKGILVIGSNVALLPISLETSIDTGKDMWNWISKRLLLPVR